MQKYIVFYLLICNFFCCKSIEQTSIVWSELRSPTTNNLKSAYFFNENEGYVVGGDLWQKGIELSTQNGGVTWQMDSVAPKQLNDLFLFQDSKKAISVGFDGFLDCKDYHSFWWYCDIPRGSILHALAANTEKRVIAVGGQSFANGVIYSYKPNFTLDTVFQFEHELRSVANVDDNNFFAVGYGIVLHSQNAGKTWQRLDIRGDFFQSITFTNPSTGFIVGASGTIWKTENAGKNWIKIHHFRQNVLKHIRFWDENNGVIVGENGTFLITKDAGKNWLQVENFPKTDLNQVFLLKNKGFIVGNQGRIFRFEY